MLAASGDSGVVIRIMLPAGIVVSCGLAVAAGFCSLFPQIAWLALALVSLPALERAQVPGYVSLLMVAGMLAAVVMLFVQLWRVRTARFVPTIRD